MGDEFWNSNAEQWVALLDGNGISSRLVTNPAVVKVVLDSGARSFLDIGCGEGWLSVELSKGSLIYRGIDGSERLIKLARQRHGDKFETVSYEQLISKSWRAEREFAALVFNFSLLNNETEALLKAVSSLVEPGGCVVIQTLHPCFTLKDYRDGAQTEDFKSTSVAFNGVMPWYGRTLQSWAELFSKAGYFIDEMIEPRADKLPVSIIFKIKLR